LFKKSIFCSSHSDTRRNSFRESPRLARPGSDTITNKRESAMNTLMGMKKTKQHGFTMIELIVVIVILGILSAVALPRFTNIQRDARIAKLNAARGAVQAAAAMIHGTVLARGGIADTVACAGAGNPGTANNTTTVCTENGRVNIVNTYPASTSAGIINAAGLSPSNWTPTNAQLGLEGYAIAGNNPISIQVTGGSAPASCSFTYTAAALNAAPVIGPVVTTGC
jgi:MSHA pilin protein MshA